MLNQHERQVIFDHAAHAYMQDPQGRSPEWMRMLSMLSELTKESVPVEAIIKTVRQRARHMGYDVAPESLYINANDGE